MTISRNEFGIIHYEEKVKKFTDEEIEEINKRDKRREMESLKGIEADGFVRFPVFFDNKKTGELDECFSYVHPSFTPSCSKGFKEKHGMDYNIYIPSYGRAGNAPTADVMMADFSMTNWYLAIDPSQYEDYKKHYPKERLIIRDPSFRSLDKLYMATSIKSPDYMHGTAGIYNFLLYFSRSMGESHYWTMDDDIKGMAMKAYKYDRSNYDSEIGYIKEDFYRCSKLLPEYKFHLPKFLSTLEDLGGEMRNVGFIGLEKFGLVFDLPFFWKEGTRLYSYYLTDNKNQCDHYGQHNNDVITSLELSKRGYVNLLFNGVCYDSAPTQSGGGLTEVYKNFGTLDKGKVLARTHPNYAKISYRHSRVHHTVNYIPYTKQRLLRKGRKE